MSGNEAQPLLEEGNLAGRRATGREGYQGIVVEVSYDDPTRSNTRRFLNSKYGHYAVLLLVSMDVGCIFADFLISLYVCDHKCEKGESVSDDFDKAQNILGIISLIFSCLFMVELLASIWAFGLSYFKSKFHCFDAAIIIAGFIIDVCLKGVLEEAGSIVVILRLWRVFKIVEEFSGAAQDQMDVLSEKVEKLKDENQGLKKELRALKVDENGQ